MKRRYGLILAFCLAIFIVACGQGPVLLRVGDPAPDFSLADRQGNIWHLAELKGQVVFINFWATWCPPCLEELPALQELYDAMPKTGFKMLAILNNDKPALADFVANQKGITIPILDDSQNLAGSKYTLTGVPETFIIDKQGILREKFLGPAQWAAPEYVQLMMKYINQ